MKFELTAPADAEAAKERVVVFAQRNGQGVVAGAAMEAVEQHGGAAEERWRCGDS